MPSIRRRGETLDGREPGLDVLEQPDAETRVLVTSAVTSVGSPVADVPPDLLNAPVGSEDDLSHALAARPPRRRLPGVTAFLGAAVLVSGGFLGGVLVQKHQGGSSSGSNAAALAAAFGRNRTGTGTSGTGTTAGAAAAGGSGTTFGTVKLVDGSTVYLTTTDGSVVKVTTGKDTSIKLTKNGTAKDLAPGTTVVVQGTAGSDGVVKASTVTQGGGGLGAGGFGGFGGPSRTGTGTGTGTGSTGGAGAPAQGGTG